MRWRNAALFILLAACGGRTSVTTRRAVVEGDPGGTSGARATAGTGGNGSGGSPGRGGSGSGGSPGRSGFGGGGAGGVSTSAGGTTPGGGLAGTGAVDPCESLRCENGGVCVAGAGSAARCRCTAAFFGERCEFSRWATSGLAAGKTASRAVGISGNGRVIVGYAPSGEPAENLYQAMHWRLEAQVELLPAGIRSIARAASFDGSAIAGDSGASPNWPFSWNEARGVEPLPHPGPPEVTQGYALDLSADGSRGCGYFLRGQSNYAAFLWNVATADYRMIRGFVPAALSADGSVLAGRFVGFRAARWSDASGLEELGALPGDTFGDAIAVSQDGNVIVGWSSDDPEPRRAFRWTPAEGTQPLGVVPEGGVWMATGVSGDGSVVVGTTRPSGGARSGAVIWTEESGPRRLDEVLDEAGIPHEGWELTAAIGVSDDGQAIGGNGVSPAGTEEAWIATLP